MTLNEALTELKHKGLPFPTPISVFYLYEKQGNCYKKNPDFIDKFWGLLELQKTIQDPIGEQI